MLLKAYSGRGLQTQLASRSRSIGPCQRHGLVSRTVLAPVGAATVEAPRGSVEADASIESVTVQLATQKRAKPGNLLKVVGSCDELGRWQPDKAPTMECTEGDTWVTQVNLPPGMHEFKVVVYDPVKNRARWETGAPKVLQVPDVPGVLNVDCEWGDDGVFTSFTAEPSPAAAATPATTAQKAAQAPAAAAQPQAALGDDLPAPAAAASMAVEPSSKGRSRRKSQAKELRAEVPEDSTAQLASMRAKPALADSAAATTSLASGISLADSTSAASSEPEDEFDDLANPSVASVSSSEKFSKLYERPSYAAFAGQDDGAVGSLDSAGSSAEDWYFPRPDEVRSPSLYAYPVAVAASAAAPGSSPALAPMTEEEMKVKKLEEVKKQLSRRGLAMNAAEWDVIDCRLNKSGAWLATVTYRGEEFKSVSAAVKAASLALPNRIPMVVHNKQSTIYAMLVNITDCLDGDLTKARFLLCNQEDVLLQPERERTGPFLLDIALKKATDWTSEVVLSRELTWNGHVFPEGITIAELVEMAKEAQAADGAADAAAVQQKLQAQQEQQKMLRSKDVLGWSSFDSVGESVDTATQEAAAADNPPSTGDEAANSTSGARLPSWSAEPPKEIVFGQPLRRPGLERPSQQEITQNLGAAVKEVDPEAKEEAPSNKQPDWLRWAGLGVAGMAAAALLWFQSSGGGNQPSIPAASTPGSGTNTPSMQAPLPDKPAPSLGSMPAPAPSSTPAPQKPSSAFAPAAALMQAFKGTTAAPTADAPAPAAAPAAAPGGDTEVPNAPAAYTPAFASPKPWQGMQQSRPVEQPAVVPTPAPAPTQAEAPVDDMLLNVNTPEMRAAAAKVLKKMSEQTPQEEASIQLEAAADVMKSISSDAPQTGKAAVSPGKVAAAAKVIQSVVDGKEAPVVEDSAVMLVKQAEKEDGKPLLPKATAEKVAADVAAAALVVMATGEERSTAALQPAPVFPGAAGSPAMVKPAPVETPDVKKRTGPSLPFNMSPLPNCRRMVC